MLESLLGFLSFVLGPVQPQTLNASNLSSWINAAQIAVLNEPILNPDPVAVAAVQRHLALLQAQGLPIEGNGVWIQAGNQVLAEHQGRVPMSAASLTKIATTLAVLDAWGPDHEFETQVSTTGSIEDGVLQGDLVIQGSGDPFFVWEEAIALANSLEQAGVKRVEGDLIIAENFIMNFETDPITAGDLLQQGFDADLWTGEIAAQHGTLPAGTPRPRLAIGGSVRAATAAELNGQTLKPLVRHQSLPLAEVLKAMNIYSNNVMSEVLADQVGGARVVAQKAAKAARVPQEEIQLINGSGLGEANRISPRAAVAMLIAIQRYLEPQQLNVADLFPVIGRDGGTLAGRQIPVASAVKTGTLNAVSSLAGVVPTRDRELIWFAIINLGPGDLQGYHQQQDLILQTLALHWGPASPVPPSLTPSDRPNRDSNRLGAASRNQQL